MLTAKSFSQCLRGWHRCAYAIASEQNTFCPQHVYQELRSFAETIEKTGNELFTGDEFDEDDLNTWAYYLDVMKEVTCSCDLHEMGCPCGRSTQLLVSDMFIQTGEILEIIARHELELEAREKRNED